MILNAPWILKLRIWPLKPLRRLQPIFTYTNQRYNSLRVIAPSIINRLQENVVQAIHDLTMLRCRPWNLIDRLKRHLLPLTRKLHTDLVPQPAQTLLKSRDVRAGLSEIRPGPGIVVHINDGVEPAISDHVYDIGDALKPNRIDGPVGRLRGEVVSPRDGDSNALETRFLCVVDGSADHGRIVPASFLEDIECQRGSKYRSYRSSTYRLNGVQSVANIPSWIDAREELLRRYRAELCRRGTCHARAVCSYTFIRL